MKYIILNEDEHNIWGGGGGGGLGYHYETLLIEINNSVYISELKIVLKCWERPNVKQKPYVLCICRTNDFCRK